MNTSFYALIGSKDKNRSKLDLNVSPVLAKNSWKIVKKIRILKNS